MLRRCQACGANLSLHNHGKLCFPCQEKRQEDLQEKQTESPYYTPEDLRFILGYENSESVRRLGRRGEIPGRLPGRRHLYVREAVDEWIRNAGVRPTEKRERHFRDLSIAGLRLASNFRKFHNSLGDIFGFKSMIGDLVYGGNAYDIVTRLSAGMQEVDKSVALNLLCHVKEEFPELANISDWAYLTSDEITEDFIVRFEFRANRGHFPNKCSACPR